MGKGGQFSLVKDFYYVPFVTNVDQFLRNEEEIYFYSSFVVVREPGLVILSEQSRLTRGFFVEFHLGSKETKNR